METKGGHTESAASLSGNLAPFMPARLCGLTAEDMDQAAQWGQDRATHKLDKTTPIHTDPQHYSNLKWGGGKHPPIDTLSFYECVCV